MKLIKNNRQYLIWALIATALVVFGSACSVEPTNSKSYEELAQRFQEANAPVFVSNVKTTFPIDEPKTQSKTQPKVTSKIIIRVKDYTPKRVSSKQEFNPGDEELNALQEKLYQSINK
jgi:hypothetical protein